MKKGLVQIAIAAYNAEKSLRATIESVIAQTYKDWILIIGDNGSADNTLEIIKEYSAKYDNIFFDKRKINFSGSFMSSLYGFSRINDEEFRLVKKFKSDGSYDYIKSDIPEWLCFLDSDDTLEPDYLDELVRYTTDNDLDMALCGWNFIRPNRTDIRAADKNEIIYKSDFVKRLPYYDKFMGPVWNKIFKINSFAKNIPYYENQFAKIFREGVYFYGADTAFNYFYLGNDLDKFGIISKPLYNYFIHDESTSRKRFNPMRIIADRRMAEVRFDFINGLSIETSDEIRDFIMNIYHKSTRATMDLLLNDDRYDLKVKMKYFHEMFACDLMAEKDYK